MSISIAVGGEFFDRLREDHCYYVDKTELIYDLVHGTNNSVTLFTRPRRFGKTLTMSMIESFFDIRRSSKAVFDGLDIMNHEEFCAEWMNQYPVLFITLKDVEGLSFDSAFGMLKSCISALCIKHAYLGSSEQVDPADAETFERLKFKKSTDDEIQQSLCIILRMMHAHYGKPAILLIDEYEVPLAKASENRYYTEMLSVIRGMMSTALKSNDHLKFGVVTGCLRIAKESIFTGVNNFASYSVIDEDFSQYFGFTHREIDKLLTAADLTRKAVEIREWYDGYIFGSEAVYCPWDAVNYVAALLRRSDAEPRNYWKNTSSNGIIRDFVERSDFNVKGKFETLMNGGTITQTISDELVYDSLHETEDNLWSVLLMTGYLTKANPRAKGSTVALRIPNKEIASIFQDTVAKFFTDHVDAVEQKVMMDALWSGDEDAASKAVSDLLFQTISYNDYHEDYYHAFLAGLFVGMGYEVESNKERGLGRPDIRLIDWKNRRALIIEAKKSMQKEQMERDCLDALNQIAEKEYAENMDGLDVTCYGIAFYKKSALIVKGRLPMMGSLEEFNSIDSATGFCGDEGLV